MTAQNKRLTKRERRLLRQQEQEAANSPNLGLNLRNVKPLTATQGEAFEAWDNNKNLMMHGIAGTGKSFLALYFGLRDILSGISNQQKIVIVRSVVEVRKMGFLPGNQKEKAAVYEAPYHAICTELFGRGDAYDVLTRKGVVEFISTSFIRGVTLNDAIVIVDEAQNCNGHELDSVITRVGKNCRIIFSGDFRQSDFTTDQERNGLKDFMRIVNAMKSFEFLEFEKEDIVRSALVKEYIVQKDNLRIVI
jgi:phosphate starvation-inducible PhoH-like protein